MTNEEHIYKVVAMTQIYETIHHTSDEILTNRYEGGRYIKDLLGYSHHRRALITPVMTNFQTVRDFYNIDEAKEFIKQHNTEVITANGKFEVCKINFKEKSRYVVIKEYAIIEGTIIEDKISLEKHSYTYGNLSAKYLFKQIHPGLIKNEEELDDLISADICSAYRIIKKEDGEFYDEYIEDLPMTRKSFKTLRSKEFDYFMGNEELDDLAYQGIRIKLGEISMIIH